MLKSFDKKSCIFIPYSNFLCEERYRICSRCDLYKKTIKNTDSACVILDITRRCFNSYRCYSCGYFEEHILNIHRLFCDELLFGYYDVLPKTPKGGGIEYVYRPLILKPEAMEAHGIKLELFNQIFVATDGAGMFSKFPGSQIDGYLLSDRRKIYTFGRQEFFGVPNERAVKRFEDLFLIDLSKYIERGRCL